jgi:ketosteroid isomerase-like protein
MRKPMIILLIATISLMIACNEAHTHDNPDTETVKKQIVQAEKDFEKMAKEKSIAEAFWQYADSNAVIKRGNDSLINGRDNIRHYYAQDFYKTAEVSWAPDFVDISPDGNMAWTYGKYTWAIKDSSGKATEYKGVFHTVWKRQQDGNWKYVWD